MADNENYHINELHRITNIIISLMNSNVKFNITGSSTTTVAELCFDEFVMRMFFGGSIEIELLNKCLLGQFKYHCSNFEYPGIVVNKPLKKDYKTIELNVYNKFLEDYYGIKCPFPAVKFNPEEATFKIIDVDDMPFHIYHALKTRTFLSISLITKKYYRTTQNEGEYEICHVVD
jgi:hypothetical protein